VAEWLANNRQPSTEEAEPDLTVTELVARYWQFAKSYYVKNGCPTDTLDGIKASLRFLRRSHGSKPAATFGPKALKAVRSQMVGEGLSRPYINASVGRIRRVFKWAVSEELVPVTVYQALTTVPGLSKGRTKARETAPVGPVADSVVDATLDHLGAIVADMVRIQRLTGCRPAEVCIVRPGDIDRTGEVWEYRPESHKTEHRDRQRVILIGPKAQQILTPYLLRPADAYCFSPVEAEAKHREARHAARRTLMSCGNRPGSRKPRGNPGLRYRVRSYRQAICRAVARANRERLEQAKRDGKPENEVDLLPTWSPNRLRHSAATEIRRRYGLEASQVVLGHAKADVTQVYAERDLQLARRVIREVG
jgi:integrase